MLIEDVVPRSVRPRYKKKNGSICYRFPFQSWIRDLNSGMPQHPAGTYIYIPPKSSFEKGGLRGALVQPDMHTLKRKTVAFATVFLSRAESETWTRDPFITSEVLYLWANSAWGLIIRSLAKSFILYFTHRGQNVGQNPRKFYCWLYIVLLSLFYSKSTDNYLFPHFRIL